MNQKSEFHIYAHICAIYTDVYIFQGKKNKIKQVLVLLEVPGTDLLHNTASLPKNNINSIN